MSFSGLGEKKKRVKGAMEKKLVKRVLLTPMAQKVCVKMIFNSLKRPTVGI